MENFCYDTYDRQLNNLISATCTLATGWDDIMTLEMTLDLKSLCLKASRLCAMSDSDYALQQQDLVHLRTQRNIEWEQRLDHLMCHVTSPLLLRVVDDLKRTGNMAGHSSSMFPCQMSSVLPRLTEMMVEDGMKPGDWDNIIASTTLLEKQFRKESKPTKFPGMDYKERFWMLYELYALQCYLLYHFHRVVRLCDKKVKREHAGARLRDIVNQHALSPEGSAELKLYWQALVFDHDNQVTVELLKDVQKGLRKEVPQGLQLCFMQHIHNLDAMALELVGMNVAHEDYHTLVNVLAKWQMLDDKIQQILHPDAVEQELYNEVFVTVQDGKLVDMLKLRDKISAMVELVTRKNHWFCLWAVLWHRGYLRDRGYGAFARQMMHRDWFGNVPASIRFTADTLSDYSGYFSERHFPVWNQQEFLCYRDTHNKKKWGDSLWFNFQTLCYRMDEAQASV